MRTIVLNEKKKIDLITFVYVSLITNNYYIMMNIYDLRELLLYYNKISELYTDACFDRVHSGLCSCQLRTNSMPYRDQTKMFYYLIK